MGKTKKCCASCCFYDVENVKDSVGRVMSRRVAFCLWDGPLPASFHHRDPYVFKHYMTPASGEDCGCYKERT